MRALPLHTGRFQKLDMGGHPQGPTDNTDNNTAPRNAATAAAKKMEVEDLSLLEDDDTEEEGKRLRRWVS